MKPLICILLGFAAFAARGQAPNIHITASGSASGSCTTGVQTPAYFNNARKLGHRRGTDWIRYCRVDLRHLHGLDRSDRLTSSFRGLKGAPKKRQKR
jgi:hypothetical protein